MDDFPGFHFSEALLVNRRRTLALFFSFRGEILMANSAKRETGKPAMWCFLGNILTHRIHGAGIYMLT